MRQRPIRRTPLIIILLVSSSLFSGCAAIYQRKIDYQVYDIPKLPGGPLSSQTLAVRPLGDKRLSEAINRKGSLDAPAVLQRNGDDWYANSVELGQNAYRWRRSLFRTLAMRKNWLALILLPLLSGCIAFRADNNLRRPETSPSESRSLTVSVVTSAKATGENHGGQGDVGGALERWRGAVEKAFRDAHLFSAVFTGLRPADYRARVEILLEQDINQAAFTLASATLLAIPITYAPRFTVKLQIESKDGQVATFSNHEDHRVLGHLILLPITFFTNPGTKGVSAVYDLTLDVLAQARDAGAI